ncbi:hypothetical protein ElyMa_000459900 [Elysia marginata]|uniref:Uncharacterized protein n=1 Tax=Elysia marginata TaxID=1093978 RepID=A0AAV4FRI9_9GAST|nr:hypothetical protein ElyMa_000459900 [Elysia marginata]
MKRSCDEPSTSSGKRAKPIRFTVQQVMDALADSDADEAEFHQEYYDNSSSDDDFNSDGASDDEDGGRSRGEGGGGCDDDDHDDNDGDDDDDDDYDDDDDDDDDNVGNFCDAKWPCGKQYQAVLEQVKQRENTIGIKMDSYNNNIIRVTRNSFSFPKHKKQQQII